MTAAAASLSRKPTTDARSAGRDRVPRATPARHRRPVRRGVDHRRQDRVHADAPLGELGGEHLGQPDDARPWRPSTRRRRRRRRAPMRDADVDDRAALGQPPCAASRHDHQAVPRFRSSTKPQLSGSESATVPPRKPPAALTTQRGVARRLEPVPERLDLLGGGQVDRLVPHARPRRGARRRAGRRATTRSPRASSASTIADPSAPPPPQTSATRHYRSVRATSCRNSRRSSGSSNAPRQNVVDRPRVLLDAAHLRAEVRRLEVHRDAARRDQRRRARPRSARRAAPAP